MQTKQITIILTLLEKKVEKLLIAALTPYFLANGVFEYSSKTEELRAENPWFCRNTFIIEKDQKIQLSHFLRKLAELGYSKVWETAHRGEFSQRGGIIRIFPINDDKIYTIEFSLNFVETINVEEGSSGKGMGASKHLTLDPRPFALGDYVVHIDHGIGVFKEETKNDFLIEYAANDILYIPKDSAQKRLSPYLGLKKPHVSRLGTPLWSITKRKAKEDIVAFAKELLAILGKRKLVTRKSYGSFPEQEEELEASFEHTDTPDQIKALREIFSDLEKELPMERILTGDVGFGKTEVALRTAYRAVLDNKQVAILAPTTILADQHFEVFKKRLSPFGVNVARLSRFEKPTEAKNILKKIENGNIDIVIGTHKLLSKYIEFKNLGLLIIDEEQKFGVAQKEHFKKMCPALDILTLTATPIPRTLSSALSGITNISNIETAPIGKMSVRTFVLPKNKKILKEAIGYEISRNGQIYFLANRIHKMPEILEEIKNLKTRAKIRILHAKMGEKAIIKTMHDFREKKFNLLLSTTIIENGLDISEANTLIVEDATKLGLAQAHQLRGRIGRGNKEAHAYFLYPAKKLKEKPARRSLGAGGAAERLEALERYSYLGAGLEIARRDLEIRGAGNILGKAQSGVAYRVGLNLYFQLLEETIRELKTEN
ncbi:MAG: DEAD/DEAH box helicase [Patescibacteria group bacterium]